MKKQSVFLMLFLMFAMFKLHAQNKTLNGQVKTITGSSLSGVSVRIIGGTTNAITDEAGNFSISASPGDSLEFSFVGFDSKHIVVGNENNITVTLNEKTNSQLGEVVVTALGIKRSERSLTYATQQINGSEVSKNKTDNFVNTLSGKVAGLTITPALQESEVLLK
ncbi:MAG: hypothetical protein DI598_12725 [Pseudopedobacter saltans]|uniref:SusC/RagA family TonB-linked outer membrane protein n=1 Tax=Pseudopedobacter saltans TaxID=151895 RepID=A0A2W5ERL5_9SPHI|nr:MAG: hypothetical protein DI598_12725 [Pseudopedobacter saltans]